MTLSRPTLAGLLALAGLVLAPTTAAAVAPIAQARPHLECHGVRATIVGTAHADRIVGTRHADVIVGLGGSDTIFAVGGNDLVCGGDAGDTVYGGRGTDRLYAGFDSSGRPEDVLVGGPGADLLDPSIRPPDGTRVYGEVGYSREPAGIAVEVGPLGRWANVTTSTGVDRVRMLPGLLVRGSAHDDTYVGSARDDKFFAGPGDDRFDGAVGDDLVYGDLGGDTASGGPGDDLLLDASQARGAGDVLDAGPGDDEVSSGAGPDLVTAGEGDDLVIVNDDGGRFDAGSGNDTFEVGVALLGGATLVGGDGRDHLSLYLDYDVEEPTAVVTLDYRSGLVSTDRNDHALSVSGLESARVFDKSIRGDEFRVTTFYYGTDAADSVWVHGPLHAWTYGGDDRVWGSEFDDELDGGTGHDEAWAGAGQDVCLDFEESTGCE